MGVLLDESELPSPTLLYYYRLYENVAFSITFVMVVVTMSVMLLSNTRAISKYRWFLIHELVWSLLFDAMGSLIGAVTLFPIPCYFGVNISSNFTGTQQAIYFFVGINTLLGKACSIMFQFEYRFIQTLAITSNIRRFLNMVNGGKEVAVRGSMMIVLAVIIFTPFVLSFPDQAEQRSYLSSLDPVVAKVFLDHPGTLCFARGTDVTQVLLIAFMAVLATPIVALVLCGVMYWSIHRNKTSFNTYRLQMMLFWSLVAQILTVFFLMVLPGLFYLGGPIFGMRHNPTVSVICFFLFLIHTPIDCFMILYFIKPYRIFLLRHIPGLQVYATSTESFSVTQLPRRRSSLHPSKFHKSKMYPSMVTQQCVP